MFWRQPLVGASFSTLSLHPLFIWQVLLRIQASTLKTSQDSMLWKTLYGELGNQHGSLPALTDNSEQPKRNVTDGSFHSRGYKD